MCVFFFPLSAVLCSDVAGVWFGSGRNSSGLCIS